MSLVKMKILVHVCYRIELAGKGACSKLYENGNFNEKNHHVLCIHCIVLHTY